VAHYSEAHWADFVRDAAVPDLKRMMQQHLDTRCNACQSAKQLWQSVLGIGRKERDFAPSPDSVRIAESLLAGLAMTPNKPFRLLFDSLLQPATAGIRGTAVTRQFLFETDDLYIDLRLEKKSPASTFLVGQVLKRDVRPSIVESFSVQVMDGKTPVSRTVTNRFGEFQLEFRPANSLCISIGRKQGNAEVILPLYE
jgi:hypothetical protein